MNKTAVYVAIFAVLVVVYIVVMYRAMLFGKEDFEASDSKGDDEKKKKERELEARRYQINLATIRAFNDLGLSRNPSTRELERYQALVQADPELSKLQGKALQTKLAEVITADMEIPPKQSSDKKEEPTKQPPSGLDMARDGILGIRQMLDSWISTYIRA
jgi:hypothetical protein